jgi:hypothetical protein
MIARITQFAHSAIEANPRQAELDSRWYQFAGGFAHGLDADFDLPCGTSAGFIAALSPLNSWEMQIEYSPPSIAAVLRLLRKGLDARQAAVGIVGPGFFSNRHKAARILAGENPLSVLSGDKVRAFYANLTGDMSQVTIDRHALAIAGWEKSLTPAAYRRLTFAYRMAAENLDLEPAEVQALTWCHWRRIKNT